MNKEWFFCSVSDIENVSEFEFYKEKLRLLKSLNFYKNLNIDKTIIKSFLYFENKNKIWIEDSEIDVYY